MNIRAVAAFLFFMNLAWAGSPLEDWIGAQFTSVVGDPTVAGFLFLTFFFLFMMFQGSSFDVKIAVMVPATILSFIFLPWLAVLFALIVGFVIYLAITKALNR